MQVVLIWFPRIRKKINFINFFLSKQREVIYAQQTPVQGRGKWAVAGGKTCQIARRGQDWSNSTSYMMSCQTQHRHSGDRRIWAGRGQQNLASETDTGIDRYIGRPDLEARLCDVVSVLTSRS